MSLAIIGAYLLIVTVSLVTFEWAWRGHRHARTLVTGSILVVVVVVTRVSVDNVPLIDWLAGTAGNLSIMTFCMGVADAFLPLYLSAVGLLPVSVYGWGFHPVPSTVWLTGVALIAWKWRANYFLLSLASASALYVARVYESHNRWDYVADPILFAFGVLVAGRCLQGVVGRRRRRTQYTG